MRDVGGDEGTRHLLVKRSNFFSTVHIADGNVTLCGLPLGPHSHTVESARDADKCRRCLSEAERAQDPS